MNISLHIDRVTVQGARLTRREREELAVTLEQELTRLLRQHAAAHRGPRAAASRPGGDARAAGDARAGSPLGPRIAREVLAALPAATFGRPAPLSPGDAR